MRLYPALTIDAEFQTLRTAGRTGSLNDMIKAHLGALGGTGTVGDMLSSTSLSTATAAVTTFNDFAHNSFFPGHIFTDLKNQMGDWTADVGTPAVDANGMPTEIPTGATRVRAINDWTNSMPPGTTTSYELKYTGTTLVVSGAVSNVVDNAGTITFDFNGGGQIIFTVTASPGAITTQIVSWCKTSLKSRLATAQASGTIIAEHFDPDYLATYDMNGLPIVEMRTMNTQKTNDSAVTDWSGASYVATRRALTTDVNQTAKGIAIEYLVALANITETDLWLCIPHLATTAYITGLAAYVRDNLDSERTVRVEYSNEMWNTGTFTQAQWAQRESVKEWGTAITTVTYTDGSAVATLSAIGPADNDIVVFTVDGEEVHRRVSSGGGTTTVTFTTVVSGTSGSSAGHYGGDWGPAWHNKKAEEARTDWEAEWTAGANVVHVIGALTAVGASALTDTINGTTYIAREPAATVPHTIFDEVGITSYSGGGFLASGDRATLQALINTAGSGGDFTAAGVWMRDYELDETSDHGLGPIRTAFQDVVAACGSNIGIRMYEGGTHWAFGLSTVDADDILMTEFAEWYQYSAYGIAVMERRHEIIADELPCPVNKFTRIRQAANSGVWGADRYVGENSALFQAMEAWDLAHDPWWLPAYAPQLKYNATTTYAITTNTAASIDFADIYRPNFDSVTFSGLPAGLTLSGSVVSGTSTATEDGTVIATATASTSAGETLDTNITFNITYVEALTYGDSISTSLGSAGTDPDNASAVGVRDAVHWVRQSGFPNFSATNLEDSNGVATTTDLTIASAGGNVDTRSTDDGGANGDMRGRGLAVPAGSMTATYAQIDSPGTYTITVYFDEHTSSASGSSGSISDGTTTYNLTSTGAARWTGTDVNANNDAVSPGNYVEFTGLSGASQVITFTGGAANRFVMQGIAIDEET